MNTDTKSPLKDKLDISHHVSDLDTADVYEQEPRQALHKRVHAHVRKHVHHLRTKPDHHKKAISFGIAFTVTIVVFIFWYTFSFPQIIAEYRATQSENTLLNRTANPIQGFKQSVENKNKASAIESLQ